MAGRRSGIDTRRQHWAKADAAARLHANGTLQRDFSELLRTLNEGRKAYWYDGDELDPTELEDNFCDVELLVAEAVSEAG